MTIHTDLTYIGPPNAYGGRAAKSGITVHSTEGSGTARDEANYARSRTDGTSSHYYVDSRETVQSLDTAYGANHVGTGWANAHLISVEFCGRSAWSTSTWMRSIDWDAVASVLAADCREWGIPASWLTVNGLASHHKGLCTHDDCRRAFGGTDHTDPGPGFPKAHLLSLVKSHLNGDDMPRMVSLGCSEEIPVRDTDWTYLKFDREYSDPDGGHADTGLVPTILRDHAFFSATVTVGFTDLPAGTTVKARMVEVRADSEGKYQIVKSYAPMEMTSTPGETQLLLSQVGSLDEGNRLRAQVRLDPGVAHAVGHGARVKCLYWKR